MTERILIIEDDKDFAESLTLKIEEAKLEAEVEVREFAAGLMELPSLDPNVVILDVYEGAPARGEKKGIPIWNRVWEQSFVPLIFVSASREDDIILKVEAHPLLRYVIKTERDAFDRILEGIRGFLPIGARVRSIRHELCQAAEQEAQVALTQTAPHVLLPNDLSANLEALSSSAMRRLAVLMRLKSEEGRRQVFAWEQYTYPAVASHLLTGDILRTVGGDVKDPQVYRVILTPSCDLAQNKSPLCLAAKCVSIREYWKRCSLPESRVMEDSDKSKKRLSSIISNLNEAQASGLKPLPEFANMIPHMAVSLRDLELLLVSENNIGAKSSDGSVFERVASIDSPYREQLVWAYLQIAGRPGLPDRDMKDWIKGILNHLAPAREA